MQPRCPNLTLPSFELFSLLFEPLSLNRYHLIAVTVAPSSEAAPAANGGNNTTTGGAPAAVPIPAATAPPAAPPAVAPRQGGPPPGFAAKPSTPSPLKGRNSFLRSLRSRTDDSAGLPPAQEGGNATSQAPNPPHPLTPVPETNRAGNLATALATACLMNDDEGSPMQQSSSPKPASKGVHGPPAPVSGNPYSGMLSPPLMPRQQQRQHLQGYGPQPGYGAAGRGGDRVLGLPEEEEAFLRSLGWSEGAEEGGLSEAEVAAYRVCHSFAVR